MNEKKIITDTILAICNELTSETLNKISKAQIDYNFTTDFINQNTSDFQKNYNISIPYLKEKLNISDELMNQVISDGELDSYGLLFQKNNNSIAFNNENFFRWKTEVIQHYCMSTL